MTMRFANPQMLWLLLVFPPAMIAFFWWSRRQSHRLMERFIEARLLPGLLAGVSPVRRKIRLGSLVLAMVFLILALARPQWGFVWEEVKQRGLDIVVAVDVSKSMLAEDIAPNRLARAKLAAMDLVKLARTDRVGLVAFAGSAFLVCPLTIDESAFRQSLEALNTNTISQGGTALAGAIQTALGAFQQEDNHKVLVMLTDGEDHDSGALEAARKAAQAGLQIFTVGIGSADGELLRLRQPNGTVEYLRDPEGNVVKSRLNEALLRDIAGATERGFYLPLRGATTMETLYEKGLAPLPKSDSAEKLVKRYHERFHWPLALALALLIGEMFFPERKRLPWPKSPAPDRAQAGSAAALVALLLWAAPAQAAASPASALREYQAGRYDQSLKEYQDLIRKKPDDPRLRFNAGAAAYRERQFDEAAKHFGEALAAPDLELQGKAYYNRGNARYWLGENQADPAKKTELWQEAVRDFESSLKLNPADQDAKHNQEYVKRRLEELQQQPPPQQQQQQKQDQSQQKQDQNQQQQAEDSQQDQQQQQNQQQAQQPQPEQAQQQQAQQQQQQQQEQASKSAEQQEQEREQKSAGEKQQQQAQQAGGQPDTQERESGEESAALGQMTPQQARQLLDAQKAEEQMLPVPQEGKPSRSDRPFRDW
ncbi:MAG TPA: VWA domain-containing protein [Candidatus Paceibacterota bacterium]|nr:VWA domain-containing protein [Candidatus Paceibacterota bacterium]